MPSATANEFKSSLTECVKVLKTARKNKVNLSSHSYYAERVPSKLASLKKSFLKLQRDYPKERFPAVAFRLATIEPLLEQLIAIYPAAPSAMLELLAEVKFKEESELVAEIEIAEKEAIS